MKLQNSSGFTAIEAVVSIVILSIVGLLIGRTFLQTGHSAIHSKESRKAAALSDMVLEQYSAYAQQDYANLESYDRNEVSPQAFFGTKDNLGYDNLRITTHTQHQESGGSLVTVKISWGGGSVADSISFTKTYADSSGNRQARSMSGI